MAVCSGSRRRCTRPSPSSMYSVPPTRRAVQGRYYDMSICFIKNPPPVCILGRTSGAGPHTQLCLLPGKSRCSHPGRKRYGNVRSMCIFGSGADCAIAVPSFFLHFLVDFLSVFVDFPPRLWYLKSCEASVSYSPHPRPVRSVSPGGAVFFLQPEVDSARYLAYTKRKRKEGIFHDS